MNLDFAVNTTKLRRILDKMPNATEAEIKAEYIKEGGLVKEIETIVMGFDFIEPRPLSETFKVIENQPKKSVKKTTVKKVKEVVKKAVKKVTKK